MNCLQSQAALSASISATTARAQIMRTGLSPTNLTQSNSHMASTSVRRKRKAKRYIAARAAAFRTSVVARRALLTLGMVPLPSWERDIHLSVYLLPTSAGLSHAV